MLPAVCVCYVRWLSTWRMRRNVDSVMFTCPARTAFNARREGVVC